MNTLNISVSVLFTEWKIHCINSTLINTYRGINVRTENYGQCRFCKMWTLIYWWSKYGNGHVTWGKQHHANQMYIYIISIYKESDFDHWCSVIALIIIMYFICKQILYLIKTKSNHFLFGFDIFKQYRQKYQGRYGLINYRWF